VPEPPTPPRPRLPSGVRLAIDEWRGFADRRYRPYQGIGVGSAAVFALAGDGLTIPLLLALGAPPAVATVIGVLPLTFSAAQLFVPSLLRRTDGNLRGVTLAILAVGETRGFVLAAIVLLHVLGILPAGLAIGGVAAVMSLGGAASAIGGTNLLAWYGAILLEAERRFVAPRVMGITQGLGAALLLPVALGVQAGLDTIGLAVYAVVFVAAGLAGLGELAAVLRLRRPGRVRVARRGERPPRSPATERFIRIIALAAAGAGFGPYLSIYAMSVLDLPASFAILISAVSSAASLAAATVVGGLLNRGSASRTLRLSFVLRGGGILAALLAFPGNPIAWAVLLVVAAVVSAGAAAGTLAANERLLRLTGGVDLISAQSRFVAGSALGVTTGQFASAGVLAIPPLLLGSPAGFAAFAILMVGSGLSRVLLAARVEVSATWSTATAAFSVDELQGRTPLPPKERPGEPAAAGWPIAIRAADRAALGEVPVADVPAAGAEVPLAAAEVPDGATAPAAPTELAPTELAPTELPAADVPAGAVAPIEATADVPAEPSAPPETSGGA
jgi:hypothetical protein